ncbi:MAG: hypothetical protein CMF42_05565 [Legionellales bacterium]|nr:hypothetical protein [Legionellales bacterium]OUX66879.1 MAG: hypothetical protein CBD38_03910 [bacterium TMED178]
MPESDQPLLYIGANLGGEWRQYPDANIRGEFPPEENSTLVFPDLNANPTYLIYWLLRHDVIEICPDETLGDEKAQFELLMAIQDDDPLEIDFYESIDELLTLKSIDDIFALKSEEEWNVLAIKLIQRMNQYQKILNGIRLKSPKHIVAIKFIGDELQDRMGDDIKVIMLLTRLSNINLQCDHLLSNHTLGFIEEFFQMVDQVKSCEGHYKGCFWDTFKNRLGAQSELFFSTTRSYQVACLTFEILNHYRPEVCKSALARFHRQVIEHLFPKLALIQLAQTTQGQSIIFTHAPLVLTAADTYDTDQDTFNKQGIDFETFCDTYNQYIGILSQNSSDWSSDDCVDLEDDLGVIAEKINDKIRDPDRFYELLSHDQTQHHILFRHCYNRFLQHAPFPHGCKNIFGHDTSKPLSFPQYLPLETLAAVTDGPQEHVDSDFSSSEHTRIVITPLIQHPTQIKISDARSQADQTTFIVTNEFIPPQDNESKPH